MVVEQAKLQRRRWVGRVERNVAGGIARKAVAYVVARADAHRPIPIVTLVRIGRTHPYASLVLRSPVVAGLDVRLDLVLDAITFVGVDRRTPGELSHLTQRKHLVVVLRVHQDREHDLLLVGEARGLAGFLAGLREDREEDGCEDGYNGDDHEQLDEGESLALSHSDSPLSSVRAAEHDAMAKQRK